MDIKGLSGPPQENPPTTGRVDTSTIHPTLATTATKPVGEQALSRLWQVGAILQLMVTQVKGKTATLTAPQLGPDAPLIQTKTDLPLIPGQQVVARVTGDLKAPSLRLVELGQSPQNILAQTLRQQLPQQRTLPPLLANLNWVAKQPVQSPAQTTPLPPQVIQIAKTLVESLPTSQQLRDPNQLFKQMHLSGQYLEHTLQSRAMGRPHFNPEQDVRSQLLRLAQALRQATNPSTNLSRPATTTPTPTSTPVPPPSQIPPVTTLQSSGQGAMPVPHKEAAMAESNTPASRTHTAQPQAASKASLAMLSDSDFMADDLLQQVDGALARIQSQQLQSLQADQQGRHVWLMELPVRHEDGIDLFDLRVERDAQHQQQGEQEQGWSLTLAFDLEGLGPIRVKVSLVAEAISATFWTELPETRHLFHEHIEQLRSRLHQSGLEVNELSCQCGIPPEPPAHLEPRLLDERA
jgi:hypothetical protein